MSEYERHDWTYECEHEHFCPDCKYDYLQKKLEPCKFCSTSIGCYCYFVPKESTEEEER